MKQASLGVGATLLGPTLTRLAAYASGDARAHPKRVVFVMQSNGMNPLHITPVGLNIPVQAGRLTNDTLFEAPIGEHALHEALEPLAAFKNKLTLLRGLSGRIALSDHSANHGALGCYPANRGPMGQTIDSALAGALPGLFPHLALGMPPNPGTTMVYSYCASGPGRAIPIVCSPELAYQAVFGSVAPERTAFQRRSHLLDFMADDVRRSREALAAEERAKFDQYLEAFESLRNRQNELLARSEALRRHAPQLGARATSDVSSVLLEAQFEIATASLIAGLTNVVTLTSGGGGQAFGRFPEWGIQDLHGIGHGASYAGKTYEQCFVEIRRFHTRQIAQLATRLQQVREGDGTMLDNTLIVYLSDSGDGHHPNLYEWPMVLLGNLAGQLKPGGRYLQFPRYQSRNHRTTASLYLTLLHAAGRPRDRFGVADPGLRDVDQPGPIQELLA
jgi:hypothetical protein